MCSRIIWRLVWTVLGILPFRQGPCWRCWPEDWSFSQHGLEALVFKLQVTTHLGTWVKAGIDKRKWNEMGKGGNVQGASHIARKSTLGRCFSYTRVGVYSGLCYITWFLTLDPFGKQSSKFLWSKKWGRSTSPVVLPEKIVGLQA